MSKINSNAKYLKALIAPKSKFKDQQNEVIKLYQERKIENLKTAEKIIEQLHSRGQKLNEKGLASLSKYTTSTPATGKIQRQVATKHDSLDRSMELTVEQTASALNSRVKEVAVNLKRIGTKVSLTKVLTEALNKALDKIGKNKKYQFTANTVIDKGAAEGNKLLYAASAPCKDSTSAEEIKKWVTQYETHLEVIIQSNGEAAIQMVTLTFTELVSGAACSQDRSKSAIFMKKSVIKIVNDDQSCFFHAMATLLNQNHLDYKYIKEGRPIRTTIAEALCAKCNMQWNEPALLIKLKELNKH